MFFKKTTSKTPFQRKRCQPLNIWVQIINSKTDERLFLLKHKIKINSYRVSQHAWTHKKTRIKSNTFVLP